MIEFLNLRSKTKKTFIKQKKKGNLSQNTEKLNI